jgi:alpha-1,2-mannosyltransferase
VPLNIVLYNIFGGSGKGPNIYGTEPWHYYFRNLALNFNLWFVLALASMPLSVLQYLVRGHAPTRQTILRTITTISPFYLWLIIFTLQPHKEERFMYPAYPLLALNAAISMHIILSYFGSTNPKELISKIPLRLRLAVIIFVAVVAIDLGLLRTIGMLTAYSAPLKVYSPLQQPGITHTGDTVCLGKEWYRFPSSFFLTEGVKAKFVRSDFRGLLPGEFSEAKPGFSFLPGAWLEPLGMNDENREDPGKYVGRLTAVQQLQANNAARRISMIVRFSLIRIFPILRIPNSNQTTPSIPENGKRLVVCRS